MLGILGPPKEFISLDYMYYNFFFIFLLLYVLDSAGRNAPNSFIVFNEPLNKESLGIIISCYYYSLSPSLSVVALVSDMCWVEGPGSVDRKDSDLSRLMNKSTFSHSLQNRKS